MILAIGLLGGFVDTYLAGAGNIATNIGTFFLSVYATFRVLAIRAGGEGGMTPRFGPAFGLSLLSGLAIALGFVLLIVPGLLLFVRWAVALPAMLREDLSITAALGRSTEMTEGNRWQILGLAVVIWIPFIIALVALGGLSVAFTGDGEADGFGVNIFVNLLVGGITVLSAICWAETYLALGGDQEDQAELSNIFA
jgi:hypothetical protein